MARGDAPPSGAMPPSRRLRALLLATTGLMALPVRAEAPAPESPELPLAEAVAGLKDHGALLARIDVKEQGGPIPIEGTFTCQLFEDKAPRTVANFVGLARGLRSGRTRSRAPG